MIGYHCGRRVILPEGTKEYFIAVCRVCGKTFKQRKRQGKKEK